MDRATRRIRAAEDVSTPGPIGRFVVQFSLILVLSFCAFAAMLALYAGLSAILPRHSTAAYTIECVVCFCGFGVLYMDWEDRGPISRWWGALAPWMGGRGVGATLGGLLGAILACVLAFDWLPHG